MNSIDENTKLFQKYLEDTAPAPEKVNKKNAYPRVQGGLPPHLLKVREDAHERTPHDTPKATVRALIPTRLAFPSFREDINLLQVPGSPSYVHASDRLPGESGWSSQAVAASELTPAASVNPPPWEDNLRDRQMGASERALPPTPTNQDIAPPHPVRRSHDSMHPALRRALNEQARLRAHIKPVVASPGDASLAVRQDDRSAQPAHPTQQLEQSGHRTPKIHKNKWRPKHSSCWESQSLPSSDVSSNFGSNEANLSFESDQSDGGTPFKDIRGSIADELDIVPKSDGTGWVNKHAWKDYNSPPGSDKDGSNDTFDKGWLPQYCSDWVAALPDIPPPRATHLQNDAETHWECDINPLDGRPMSPVDYPLSTVNPQDPGTREELVRRMSGTAEIRVTMEAEKLRKRMKHREKKEKERAERYLGPRWKRVSASPMPMGSPNTPDRLSHGYEQPPDQTTTAPVESRRADHREPQIPCYLRPVERYDLPQILSIYNWEVEHGRQALDAKPLVLQDIQRLFAESDAAGTPFIVAVKGTPPHASTPRGGESALVRFRGPYRQPEQSGPCGDSQATPTTSSSSDKILGFGLITLPSAGLAGNAHTSVGRFNGKVHFYVEPLSRRLGVGRCIMHRLLRCCSKHLLNADWYRWYDPYGSKACAESGYNMRNYARVFAEVASFKGDPDFSWRKKLLEEMKFLYVNTTDLTRKVIHDANGGWFDNTVWQHDCGGPGDIHESN